MCTIHSGRTNKRSNCRRTIIKAAKVLAKQRRDNALTKMITDETALSLTETTGLKSPSALTFQPELLAGERSKEVKRGLFKRNARDATNMQKFVKL